MLPEHGVDAMLCSSLVNIRYVSGFSGSNALLLVGPRTARLYTDSRYEEQAAAETRGVSVHVARRGTLLELAESLGHFHPGTRLGIEADHLTVSMERTVRKRSTGCRVIRLEGLVESLRLTKDAVEISAIRHAVSISDTVFSEILPLLDEGVSERDIAAEISFRHRRHGAERDAFEPIVLFGRRTSLIHGSPGAARLRAGAPVLIDMGCRWNGYCSDMTRMVCVGAFPQPVARAMDGLREAVEHAASLLRPGESARTIDSAARTVLASTGMAEYFPHALGHGVGLDIHELPRLSPMSDMMIREGDVVTIEPGVYFPGRFGARLENLYRVTASGAACLTRTPLLPPAV